MASSDTRGGYPAWVATGAGFGGTLLGAVAMWFGVQMGARSAVDVPAVTVSVEAPSPSSGASPATGADPTVAEGPTMSADADGLGHPDQLEQLGDPGDSPLVRAVASTRDSVVTLDLAGRVRGAGVVLSDKGLLLTNYHVIEPVLGAQLSSVEAGAGWLTARYANGRARAAKVVATDVDEDLAILQLERDRDDERFAKAPIGRSQDLRLGEQVFAIGAPVGFEATVVTGIVSALDRTGVLANPALPVIQLDAAINFGNSGGPLFNLRGELVGITAARSARGEGIGFAIPIDHVLSFLRALVSQTRGRAGAIGVRFEPEAEVDARIAPLGYRSGLTVAEVESGRPAAAAGLRSGDIIVAIRGRRYDELGGSVADRWAFAQLLIETVRSLLPGETLSLEVIRDGSSGSQLVELELTVEAASVAEQVRIDAEELLGLQLDITVSPPVISALMPGSPVASARDGRMLLRGRIVELFGRKTDDLESLAAGLTKLRSWASGGRRSIAITFELEDGTRVSPNSYPLVF